MADWIANARMYAVTPAVEDTWRRLLERIANAAELPLQYVVYPAPQPLERLWSRSDLGCVFMCGYALTLGLGHVAPIAAPIPSAAWARGRPVYRSELIVSKTARFRRLEDSFGRRAGWTVTHSHSGFNAFRYHLLKYRSSQRPTLYGDMTGGLITARAMLDAVRNEQLDIGPLDAYWYALLAHHAPQLTAEVRVLASTDLAPMPAFVASCDLPADDRARLREAFLAASAQSWFAPFAEALLINGFAAVSAADYAVLMDWDRQAKEAGYEFPA
jgi:ABC-type phosphate/phosphonate transport system substrate-binding protein